MACILVIDDDNETRARLRVALEYAGHEVREATGGEQGIRSHRARPADLVLCDLVKAGTEGLETIRELRGDSPGVKIIAMSGGAWRGELSFLAVALKRGAAGVLQKPFTLRALLGLVGEVLGGPGTLAFAADPDGA
jgi:DNA-binding response OmpR family regulator